MRLGSPPSPLGRGEAYSSVFLASRKKKKNVPFSIKRAQTLRSPGKKGSRSPFFPGPKMPKNDHFWSFLTIFGLESLQAAYFAPECASWRLFSQFLAKKCPHLSQSDRCGQFLIFFLPEKQKLPKTKKVVVAGSFSALKRLDFRARSIPYGNENRPKLGPEPLFLVQTLKNAARSGIFGLKRV